ncbi:TPA: hypothetical protein P5N67_003727 [Clostridioides difficile]|nr:hypothetical protein [Clostridioides difficile]MCI9897879.1 hypothetical protein [Clostridioides difficile]MCI9970807.1 hypothetical protein [Clostridioides difficile]MCJ0168932.1 hypothetical protein [Clostridioides difficile]MCJ0188242.1 hypothetical protein [Clostridioides difficile]
MLEQNKKLLDIEEKIKQLKAQKQAIINKEKEKERKARTKRLIEIGAIMDSMGIDSIDLANEFKNYFNNNEKSKLWLESFIEKNKA